MRAVQAQKELPLIQGNSSIWYCGAWTGFGFHEDGLWSAHRLCAQLLGRDPWDA
jgi:predicted NAD/FAD-binding protein